MLRSLFQSILLCAALLLASAIDLVHAAAPEADDGAGPIREAEMQAEMHRYFAGEKLGGTWLMGVGAPAVALGTGLMFQRAPFSQGLAASLLALGAIELVGGGIFSLNTNRRVPRFDRQLATHAFAFRQQELARIGRVNQQMRFLEGLEITLILSGGAMTAAGALQRQDLLAGIGTGLMIETAVILVYDQLAARRALRYTDRLTRFGAGLTGSAGPTPRGVILTATRAF